MSFLTSRKMIGFKLEGTPYTAETLAATDYDICASDITYDPDIAMMVRKCAKGNFGKELSIAGKRKFTTSFKVPVQEGSAISVPPAYYKCVRACAFSQATSATGAWLDADSDYSNVPATIEIVEKDEGTSADGVLLRGKGMMGNLRLVVNTIGEPLYNEFEFQGALDTIERRAFASMLVPTGFDSAVPDAVMGVTLSAFGDGLTLDKITIDMGNDVQVFTDPSAVGGVSGAHVVERTPVIDIDPDLVGIDSQDWYTRWTAATEGALLMEVGDNINLSSSSLQVDKAYAPGDREGHVVNNLRFNIVDDDFRIIQGAE